MAKMVLTNAAVLINGTSLADHATSVTIEDSADEVDFTSFSANGYKEIGAGLKDATITIPFFADFATNSVHQILQPLYQSGGTFSIEVRPVNTTVSATNPKATMTARLFSYPGFAGNVGEAAMTECAFRNAGTAGLVWGTT